MAHYPGYTVLRTEDCPEQHGTLTLLTHDVSGAAVLLVENEDVNKAFGIGFGTNYEYLVAHLEFVFAIRYCELTFVQKT